MITGININEVQSYVSKHDPDKNNPTKFLIGVLDPNLRSFIEDQTTSFEFSSKNPSDAAKANINAGKRNLLAVKFGLRGIENFLDPETKAPVQFSTNSTPIGCKNYPAVTERILAMVPREIRDELAEVILNENVLNEDEIKN